MSLFFCDKSKHIIQLKNIHSLVKPPKMSSMTRKLRLFIIRMKLGCLWCGWWRASCACAALAFVNTERFRFNRNSSFFSNLVDSSQIYFFFLIFFFKHFELFDWSLFVISILALGPVARIADTRPMQEHQRQQNPFHPPGSVQRAV